MTPRQGQSGLLVPLQDIIESLPGQHGAMGVRKDGTCVMVLRASAVNVDYRSEDEHNLLLSGFESFCASLTVDGPIQILSHAKRQDPEAFFRQFATRMNDIATPQWEKQLIEQQLRHTAQQLSATNPLERQTYIVIGFGDQLGPYHDNLSEHIPFVRAMTRLEESGKQRTVTPVTQMQRELARDALDQRAQHVIAFAQRFEVIAEPLEELELLDLLYQMFHPGLSNRQKFRGGQSLGSITQQRSVSFGSAAAAPVVEPEVIPPTAQGSRFTRPPR